MKRFIGYLFYTLFVGVIVYWGIRYGQNLRIQSERTFSLYLFYRFIAIFPIVIGMFLGLPRLISRVRQKGGWTIDWQILLSVGLPTLLINITILMTNNFSLIKYGWFRLIVSDTRVFDISGIVFGYILLSSLVRTNSNKEIDV